MNIKMTECDRPCQNKIDKNEIIMEQAVKEIKREKEYGREKIQVILRFPESSDHLLQIKDEVSEILKMELQRQIKNTKGVVYHEESKDIIEGQFQSAVGGGR